MTSFEGGFVQDDANRFGGSAAAYATALLFFANLIGYLDRSILTLLVQAVKTSLLLSDSAIGLMLGAGFVLTFSLAGLFIGRLVDRVNRRNLLIAALAIWSLSAAAGGLAHDGVQLFLSRMGVGVGEAALFPIAVSLIADYFEPSRRGKPYGLFTTGVYAGGGLSLILAGAVLPWATTLSARFAAGGHLVEPWRIVLFLMLIPGVVGCSLLATMREPPRRHAPSVETAVHRSGYADWRARAGVFVPHHLFMSAVTLALVAITAWMPTVLIREHAMAARSVGLMFGTVIAVTGVASSALAGVLADRASRRAGAAGPLLMAVLCVAVGLVGYIILAVAHTPLVLMIGVVVVFSPLSMCLIAGIIAMSDLSPARSRGQITSVYFLFTGVLGTAGGPVLVGYLNDLAGGHRLGRMLSLTGIVACVLALALAAYTNRCAKILPVAEPL